MARQKKVEERERKKDNEMIPKMKRIDAFFSQGNSSAKSGSSFPSLPLSSHHSISEDLSFHNLSPTHSLSPRPESYVSNYSFSSEQIAEADIGKWPSQLPLKLVLQ